MYPDQYPPTNPPLNRKYYDTSFNAVGLSVLLLCAGASSVLAFTPWRHSFHEPLPEASVLSSNLAWDVNVEGNTYFEVEQGALGSITFTNVVADIARNPVLDLLVPRAQGTWRLFVGRTGSAMSNVHTSTKSGRVRVDLSKLGWTGVTTNNVRLELQVDTSAGAGTVVPFDLSDVAEKDVVYEAMANTTTLPFGGNPAAQACFVEEGWTNGDATCNGLPTNRTVASRDAELGNYTLLPYDKKNVIELATSTNAAAETQTIDVPHHRYSKIGLLVSAEGGEASFTIKLNYLDGSTATDWVEADDWYQLTRSWNQSVSVGDMARVIASNGAIDATNHFNVYEFIFSNIDTTKVLRSISIGNDPNRWPGDQARYIGVFAMNGRAFALTNAPHFLEARDLKFEARPGWTVFDAFDTHPWRGEVTTAQYGFWPELSQNGWKHPLDAEYSYAHPNEGEMALRMNEPIMPEAQYNFMNFEIDLPEPENWYPNKLLTFEPYMEKAPLGFPLVGLTLVNAAGKVHRIPLILGWQLFQWENRQMTWALQGNVEAGIVNGVTQWQIPPIDPDVLSNVVKVKIGYEYYYDPTMKDNYVHVDNMRFDAKEMWDSFDGPSYRWTAASTNLIKAGISHNVTFDGSAGSLCVVWPAATSVVRVATASTAWEENWQAFSLLKLRVWATRTNAMRIVVNNSVTTTTASVTSTGKWVTLTWNLPTNITQVSGLAIDVVNPSSSGKIYADRLEVGTSASRVEKLAGWALKDGNQLTWSVSDTSAVQNIRVVYRNDAAPTNELDGTLVANVAPASKCTLTHAAAALGSTYYYGVFLQDAGGAYYPATVDSATSVSRDLLVLGGATNTFQAAFSKANGALVYIYDNTAGRTVSYGNEDLSLWRVIFYEETLPALQASWFNTNDANLKFSYTASPLALNYHYANSSNVLDLSVVVDLWASNRLRMKISLTNNMSKAIRTVEAPEHVTFAVTNVNTFAYPIQEGVQFTKTFFTSGRYSVQPRPWLFADYMGLDSADGLLGFYAVQDSKYGADILPHQNTNSAVFQPSNVGVVTSHRNRDQAYMVYEMLTFVPPGKAWSSPTLVLESGGSSIRSSLASYKTLNGFLDTNRYSTLKQKLDAFGLFDKMARSPLMAIECEKAINWQKAPEGQLWNSIRGDWFDILPRDNVLHITHWQKGILEDEHPEALPIWWDKYGDEASYHKMISAVHDEGWLVQPFVNWTVWNKHDVVERDAKGTLLPVPEACLKPRGTDAPFYEYNGYMVKPWNDSVFNTHSNMMMDYRTNYNVDIMFIDMTCERTWRYTRIDTNADGVDESIFTGYTQATINHNNYLKKFYPLYTEGVFDMMLGEVSGYCQTMRQKYMMDILAHIGAEFNDWTIFPLAADVAHRNVGFYQHDLNLQVFPRTKRLLTHYTTMGYCYIVDVATWFGESDLDGMNWMYICDDFQKSVVSKYFGQPLNSYNGAVGGNPRLIQTSYSSNGLEVTMLANFQTNATFTTNSCTISPEGFMATMPSNQLLAGCFRGTFNGAALSTGDHYIVVEKITNDVILVKHPGGINTSITMPKPATWTGEVLAAYVLRDRTEILAPGKVSVVGSNLVLNYTKETVEGAPVAHYKLVNKSSADPLFFLSNPTFETVSATQTWVLVRANKAVTAVASYGIDFPTDYAVTNATPSYTHAVLVNLPIAGTGYYFKVKITATNGQTLTSGRIYYPGNGVKSAEDFSGLALGETGVYRFNLAAVAEKDIVYNAGDATNDVFGEWPGDVLCFGENGWSDGSTTTIGLPTNRQVKSADANLGTYHLLPYSGKNVIELNTTNATDDFYFQLPTPAKFKKFGLLVAAAQGNASLTFKIHYKDWVNNSWFAADDWYSLSRPAELTIAITNMHRVVASNGAVDTFQHFNLYECNFDQVDGLDTNLDVVGISIAEAPNAWSSRGLLPSYAAVFAINGISWSNTAYYDLNNWRDGTFDTALVARVRVENGQSLVSIKGVTGTNGSYGKVLSPKRIIDLDRFPILDMTVSKADLSLFSYEIGVQEEVAPFRYYPVLGETRAGSIIANLAKITGWGGPRPFSISIGISNASTNQQEIAISKMEIRADRSVAWEDEFDPARASWRDETQDSSFNAELEPWGVGLSRLRQDGSTNWGQVQSEMLALDLADYPWATVAVNSVDPAANFSASVQYQTPPYNAVPFASGASAPYTASGQLGKAGTNALDLIRGTMVVEGSNKTVLVDALRFQKRAPGQSQLIWDRAPLSLSVGPGTVIWQPYTATHFEGKPVTYSSANLPAGATYDRILQWTVPTNASGTYRPTLFARDDQFVIAQTIAITVTNATNQLVAPLWASPVITVSATNVTATGTYAYAGSSNVIVQVSVNGAAYTNAGVTLTNGQFVFARAVTNSPMTLNARCYNTSTLKVSSANRCDVYSTLIGPAFLRRPVLEGGGPSSVWVMVAASTQVTATVTYGRIDPNEGTVVRTNLSLTHAVLVTNLLSGWDYWFQVAIKDAQNRATISEKLLYPVAGAKWKDTFDTASGAWRDRLSNPAFGASLAVTNGNAVVSLPAVASGTSTNGKILSSPMTVDFAQYPILEIAIADTPPCCVGYEIRLQEEQAPYTNLSLFADSQPGTMVLNIPQLTGWTSTRTFSIEFSLSSIATSAPSVSIDYMLLRADSDVAWQDGFNPMRATWRDETQNTYLDCELEDLGNGTARLRHVGTSTYGIAESELVIMDLGSYPWMTFGISNVSPAANFKGDLKFDLPPYAPTTIVSGADAPYIRSGIAPKYGTSVLDRFRANLVIEGQARTAIVDTVSISKRALNVRTLYWDNRATNLLTRSSVTSVVAFTATEFAGTNSIEYSAAYLPTGATYNGCLKWAPATNQLGTYWIALMAKTTNTLLTEFVSITVTDATLQLVAPRFGVRRVPVTGSNVTVSGACVLLSTNDLLEIDRGAGFSTAGVACASGAFTWTGAVTSNLSTVRGRMRNPVTGKLSSTNWCEVYRADLGPAFTVTPILETENDTSVWVLVRAQTQVSARVYFGRPDADENLFVSTNRSYTHGVLVNKLSNAWDFCFQVVISNSANRFAASQKLSYPAAGCKWRDEFLSVPAGWRDNNSNPGFSVTVSNSGGLGSFNLPAAVGGGQTNGKALSAIMTVDVDRFPLLEVNIATANYPNVGYEIGLQEEQSPYEYKQLFADSRSGTLILNVPQLTGWSSSKMFSISFAMSSADTIARKLYVDYIRLRTDRNAIWDDPMNPPRRSWIGEAQDPTYNAILTNAGGGIGRLYEVGHAPWGQVQSEMLVMDVGQYPWHCVALTNVASNANFKLNVQYQTPPYAFTSLVGTATSAVIACAELAKFGTNKLDLLRQQMVIEGVAKDARVDAVVIAKHVTNRIAPYWDYSKQSYCLATNATTVFPFTATDYRGATIYYSASNLPSGATYDGFFRWTPSATQTGTFRPCLIATSVNGRIDRRVAITVTNATLQLVAPTWNATNLLASSNIVAVSGTYWPGSGVVIQVSVTNATSFSTAGVSYAYGTFTWTGRVEGLPTPLYVRAYNPAGGKISSAERMDVLYAPLVPTFLGCNPVLEMENRTQVWVMIRSDDPVKLGISFGTSVTGIGANTRSDTNLWATHATLITPLVSTQAYWFRVTVTNAGGYVAISSNLYYPAQGQVWQDAFGGPVTNWITNNIAQIRTNGQGQAVVTLPAGQVYGTVETPPMTLDVDQFPIFDMLVTKVDSNAQYVIILKDAAPPYQQPLLISDTRPGTAVLHIPTMTGWKGIKTFSVAVGLYSTTGVARTMEVDYLTVRSERNVAWEEPFNPIRSTWIDEDNDTNLNAIIESGGTHQALLRQAGPPDVWGQVRSEMVFIDVQRYRWYGLDDYRRIYGATLKAGYDTQIDPYKHVEFVTNVMSTATSFYNEQPMTKYGSNAPDRLYFYLVVEGLTQQVGIVDIKLTKRSTNQNHLLYWDFPASQWKVPVSEPVALPFTATDYQGASVTYGAQDLPQGAKFDGVFRWTPAVGTYATTFFASNGFTVITNTISITVTSIYTVRLGYDATTGADVFPAGYAEETNYTAAAAIWMTAKYLNSAYTNLQGATFAVTVHDPAHRSEITPASMATNLTQALSPIYTFTNRSLATFSAALREIVFWMDYVPVNGKQTPVSIVDSTNWYYKVCRGFQTDVKPYTGGQQAGTNFTVYGLWINDPRLPGLGFNQFVTAIEMTNSYAPSDATGNFYMVTDPPHGAELAEASDRLERLNARAAPAQACTSLAGKLRGGGMARRVAARDGGDDDLVLTQYDLAPAVPAALGDESAFRALFQESRYVQAYRVNAGQPDEYVLAAGGLAGPGSTVYLLRISPEDGSIGEVTWCLEPSRFLPVNRDAAIWLARRDLGDAAAAVVDAKLVYDRNVAPSRFFPAWEIRLQSGKDVVTSFVDQFRDLGGDADQDGASDGDELFAGSDPSDAASRFEVGGGAGEASAVWGEDGVTIRWPSVAGKIYSVHRATSLIEGFTKIAGGIAATPPVNEFKDRPDAPVVYYRIEVE